MKISFSSRLALVFLLSTATLPAQTYKVLYNFGAHAGDPSNPRYSGTMSQGGQQVVQGRSPYPMVQP